MPFDKSNREKFFLDVLEKNKAKIFRICMAYANPVSAAEDLFQEVTLAIWGSLPRFEGRSSIDTWVYRIALNVYLKINVRFKKEQRESVQIDSLVFHPTGDSSEKEIAFQKLLQCIHTLKESDRAIVLLYLDGLAYKDIADVLGLSENLIAVRMKRLKNKLLTCITNNNE